MADWQKCADTITRSFFGGQMRYDAYRWLQEAESKIRPLLEGEDETKKHVYFVPIEDGSVLEADFHTSYTIISLYDTEMKKKEIVGEKASRRGESAGIRAFSSSLKKNKAGFGYPHPEALMNMFRSLRVDELFTFENGISFLCTEKNGNIISLKKVFGNIIEGCDLAALLEEGKSFDVDASSTREIQALYRLIYDKLTDSAKGRITSYQLVKEYVKNLKAAAGNNSDKRIDIGPMIIHLKKPFMSAAKWVGADNNTLTDEQMVSLYAWMSNAPVIVSFIHEDEQDLTRYDDTCFYEYIEQFFKEGKFDNVYRSICEYVLRLSGKLKVEIKTYIKNDDDYIADGFVFTFENGGVMMRRATFEENDITRKIITLKKSPSRVFGEFLAEKYNSDYFLMKNNKRSILRKALPKSEYIVN